MKKEVVINKFCHIEIPAPKFNETIEFYSKVFGWEVQKMDRYAIFQDGLVGGGGLLYERISQEDYMISLRAGLGIPGYISESIIIQNGKNAFSLGIGGSVFFGYMRAW